MEILKTALVVLLVFVIGAGIFLWSGLYDPGADDPHWKITYALMEASRDRSVEHRASTVILPVDLSDAQLILNGASHYAAMCSGCHLAPGMKDTELRSGLYPQPPNLSKDRVDTLEAFWIIKHGLKMSAMPAWGASHNDATIWSIVAFLRKLPGMTPEKYKEIVALAPSDEDKVPMDCSVMPAPGNHTHNDPAHAGN